MILAQEDAVASPRPRIGRAPATNVAQISHTALRLFIERGFDQVTVDDIARAVGIGRRTFFRYFPSKNDLPWGDFERLLESMREFLDALPADLPLMEALHRSVLEFNRFPDDEMTYHRQRMTVLLTSPTLVAHSTLRYASWRQVIADFAGRRLGIEPGSLVPQTIGHVCLGISIAAYERWLRHDDAELLPLIDQGFLCAADSFRALPHLGPR